MSLFRKKKGKAEEELPELPKLPELPELPKLSEPLEKLYETRNLPSFPNSEISETLNQEAVKSALRYEEPQEEKQEKHYSFPKTNRERRTVEISEIPATLNPKEEMLQPSMLPSYSSPLQTISQSQFSKKEPVYIRIDKFKSALANFQEIQTRIFEIENLLKKIKEVKQKEDSELREWEKELETVKSRIDAIDKNIFSKLE